MVTRTPQGTASSKASGTTLIIPNVSVPAGHCLVSGGAYANGALAPTTVEHAGKTLRRKIQQNNATRSIHASMWLKGEYRRQITGDLAITWSTAIVERAFWASSLDFVAREDDASGSEDAATTTPATGRTGALVTAGAFVVGTKYEIVTLGNTDFEAIGASANVVGTVFTAIGVGSGTGEAREALTFTNGLGYAMCVFGGEGPEGDSPGSAEIRDGGSLVAASVGQEVGTIAGGAASNIKATETFLELTSDHFTRGRLVGATQRRWVNCILALEPRPTSIINQGITPSDIVATDAIVDAAGGNTDDIYFGYDEDTGEWKAYEATTPGTLRATRSVDTGDWT